MCVCVFGECAVRSPHLWCALKSRLPLLFTTPVLVCGCLSEHYRFGVGLSFNAYWLRAPTGLTLKKRHSAHAVFICFIFISEQTANSVPCNINWLVFITEMKSAYCAVRTGSLNKALCASSLKVQASHT
jgi:hypothetical protein